MTVPAEEICYDMKDNKSMGCIYARVVHFLLASEGVVLWGFAFAGLLINQVFVEY